MLSIESTFCSRYDGTLLYFVSVKLFIEAFFVTIQDQNIFYYKNLLDITDKQIDPDILLHTFLADEYSLTPNLLVDTYFIHSTSWRYESDGALFITYIIYSDALDLTEFSVQCFPLSECQIAANPDPTIPRPIAISDHHVVTHALRHVHFLLLQNDDAYLEILLSDKTKEKLQQIGLSLGGKFVV